MTTLLSRHRNPEGGAPPARNGRITGRQALALGVMCFTVLLISLDQTVLNVALPTLVKELHPSSSGLQWIADSYTLTNAVLLLFGGALGDRFGRRRLFLIGVTIFGGGSLACALVHSTGPLIAARAVMGLGAALLTPATLALIADTFTGRRRARAIGIWAGVGGIGAAAGPLLGGWLLQHFWWGSVFLINVPIAVVALAGGLWTIAEHKAASGGKLDPIGLILSSLGLTALTYAFIVTSTDGWASHTVLGSLAIAVALLVGFVLWDRKRSTPFLDLRLFADRTFSSALAAVTAVFFALFGVSFLISQYIQFVQGADPFGVGIRFLPSAIGSLVGSNIATRLEDWLGLRKVMLAGMVLTTGGLVALAGLTVGSGFTPIGVATGLIGLGIGIVVAPASHAIVGTLPSDKVGAGSGLRAMVQLLGGALGVAIIGSLAAGAYRSSIHADFHTSLRAVPASARPAISNQIGDALGAAQSLPRGLAHATRSAASHAFVDGLHLSSLVGLGFMAAAMAATLAYVPARTVHVDMDDPDLDVAAHM